VNINLGFLTKVKIEKYFLPILITTLIFRFILAGLFSFTGDESAFALLGRFPSMGLYDHTPLIGWIIHVMFYFGDSQTVVRIPTIILPAIVALGIYTIGKEYDSVKAKLIAILFLITPANLLTVLIANDTAVTLFSFLSGLFLFFAIKRNDNLGYYFLSGLCLGLAFFSKYFAVLLGIAYLVYFIVAEKSTKRTVGFSVLLLAVLPFGLENLYWNYTHDWTNIVFNLYNRNKGDTFHWYNTIVYLLSQVLLLTPPVAYFLYKDRQKLLNIVPKEFKVFLICIVVPFVLFFLLSLFRSIGLHWSFSFIPFVFLCFFVCADREQILYSIRFNCWFSGILTVILLVFLALPFSVFQRVGFKGEDYTSLVYLFKHKEVRAALDQYNNKFIFAHHSYATATMLYFDSQEYAPVFGVGSVNGRQSDLISDFNAMSHKNFLILSFGKPKPDEYKIYFKKTEVKSFELYGATFYYTLGYDFNLKEYRERVLRKILDDYWTPPAFLPRKTKFFCSMYFTEAECSK